MTEIKINERLYLSKAEDIYVDHHQLKQHQVDALRLLYAQYKKETGGVILNDPSGYGKTVVAVLFLQALQKVLPSPALVLCRAAELQHWRHHFHTWASTEDVIFESSNPYVKKSIFVNTRQQLPSLCRRTWSVAVVDDELPRDLQADFKIFITNEDMKENLVTFASIYNWMFPKGEPIDVKMFSANKNDPADVEKKVFLLDFICEETVFRSKNFTPFTKPEIQAPTPIITPSTPIVIEPPRITRKNKDATGTKIKRSKARIEGESNHAAKIPRTDTTERNSTITSKDYYKDDMDVESFIKNERPITGEGVEEFMDFQAMIKSDTENFKDIVRNERLNGDQDTVADENTDVCTVDYQNAINDIVNNENDNSIEKSEGNIDVKDVESDSDTGKDTSVNVSTEYAENVISVSNDKVEVSKNETIQVANNEPKKDLETKLTELEEKTLNKFKGSVLDSIF